MGGQPRRKLSNSTPVPVRRNDKGGILIKEEELKVAWDFFDTKGTGKLTAADIKRRLTTFYKNVSNKEIKFLLNNQQEITFEDLYELLKDNQLTNFDPVKEAFKVYDPNTGFVDMEVVKEFFANLNYGDISDDVRMMVPFGQPDTKEKK